MNVDVRTEINIDRSRADVASYASNPDNATASPGHRRGTVPDGNHLHLG
jgi:hypothetical protein